MGRDKAQIVVADGRRLVDVAIDALLNASAAEVMVVGGLPSKTEHPANCRLITDDHPGEGPLGGIITALRNASEEIVVVLACDHVAADARAVLAVVDLLGDDDVALPVVEGQLQTMHGAWHRRSLPALESVFGAGRRSVRDAVVELDVVECHGLDAAWLRDTDTPGDLA